LAAAAHKGTFLWRTPDADETINLVVSARVPCERAALGTAAMRHGKDYLSDKPGFTTLDHLTEAGVLP
jgi:predicted dehydrogenase